MNVPGKIFPFIFHCSGLSYRTVIDINSARPWEKFVFAMSLPLRPNGVFVFVITGALEVQYRLLEAKDWLAIWDMQEMELEDL